MYSDFVSKIFLFGKKALYNVLSLDLSNPFNFQTVIYSVPFFSPNILNVGWQTYFENHHHQKHFYEENV